MRHAAKRPYRLGAAVFAAAVLLSLLLVSAPGRSPAGPLTEPAVPLVPAAPPAAAPQLAQPAPGAPAGPAVRAAEAAQAAKQAAQAAKQAANGQKAARDAARRAEAADRAANAGGTDPLFAPALAPASEGVTPKVARLRLGSFDQPAAGVQMRAGVPRGVPLEPDARGLRDSRATRTLTIRKADTARFSALGVTWTGGTRATVSVAVRSHVPQKGWGPWRTAGAAGADREPDGPLPQRPRAGQRDPAAADRREPYPNWRDGTDLIWLGAADGIEVLVTGPRGRGVSDLLVDLIDPLQVPADQSAAAPAEPGAPGPASAAPGAGRVARPAIARRADWGADERMMTWTPVYTGPVKAAAFHHTATDNRYEPADVPRILRAIYYFHAVSRGWGDIGYNVLVDRFGRLWEGRYGGLSRPVVGAHTGGFNRYTAGIAVLGDHRSVAVPAAAVDAGARYIAWKLSLGPAIDPRGTVRLTGGGSTSRHPPGTTVTVPRVFPHRLTNPTECPGNRGMDALPALRDRAAALMGAWTDPATLRVRLATWRPADAHWRILGGADPAMAGATGDLPVGADYDGDGSHDPATWTPGTGLWRIVDSGAGQQYTLGGAGDRPVPADYDGDGRAEPAVWRPSGGVWLLNGGSSIQWGSAGDVPVPADYNGDGRTDLAVWRPSNGTWYVLGVGTYRLGEAYHIPVPADYDGDGDAEPASWSPVSHRWFVWGLAPTKFGQAGDVPVPGQYDGDGRADLAVWRPSGGGAAGGVGGAAAGGAAADATGTWLINQRGSFAFGRAGDVPIALP
jgi:hypothetical protein